MRDSDKKNQQNTDKHRFCGYLQIILPISPDQSVFQSFIKK
ncbi:MAG: hypothetical protein RJA25_375 [Bacteroidota bacterium]|jgi:hypothetical protein